MLQVVDTALSTSFTTLDRRCRRPTWTTCTTVS